MNFTTQSNKNDSQLYPQINKQLYDNKRKVRSKIIQLFNKEHFSLCDEFFYKNESFNKKMISSLDFNLKRIIKQHKNFRFEKRDQIDEMKNIFIETSHILKNKINPEELLKKNLNGYELQLVRDDINYFIKDPKIRENLDFLKTKTLVQKLKVEEEQQKIKQILCRRRNIMVGDKIMKTVNKLNLHNILHRESLSSPPTSTNNSKRKDVDKFTSKLKEITKHIIENQQKKVSSVKYDVPCKIINTMTKELQEVAKIPAKINQNSSSFNNYSNCATVANKSQLENSTHFHSEAKITHINQINNMKERNKKLQKMKEKNNNEMKEEIMLKKKINDIKENFLITNINVTRNKQHKDTFNKYFLIPPHLSHANGTK